MNQVQSVKVPFTAGNVGKCACPKCPVQAKSACVGGQLSGIREALARAPLNRAEIPGLYCATGTATCFDLDPKQSCLCGGCPIFSEYSLAGLKPVGYYCRDGSAS
jgi:hypothetical protein